MKTAKKWMKWGNFIIEGNVAYKEIRHKYMYLSGANKEYPFKLFIQEDDDFALFGELKRDDGYMAFDRVILQSLKGEFTLLENFRAIDPTITKDPACGNSSFNIEKKLVRFFDSETIKKLYNFLAPNDKIDVVFRSLDEDDRISKLEQKQITGLKETLELYFDLVDGRKKLPCMEGN
jgi:hypothetical protein